MHHNGLFIENNNLKDDFILKCQMHTNACIYAFMHACTHGGSTPNAFLYQFVAFFVFTPCHENAYFRLCIFVPFFWLRKHCELLYLT